MTQRARQGPWSPRGEARDARTVDRASESAEASGAILGRPREADVLRQVLEALSLFGVDVARQNTGAFLNPQGQLVRCGQPGNADVSGMLTTGPGRGRKVDVEVKRPGFDPRRPGNAAARQRWARQLARLRRTNAQGGYGWWTTDARQVTQVLRRINDGWRVVIDEDGWPWMTDEPEGVAR
jgi:hypothetical protein